MTHEGRATVERVDIGTGWVGFSVSGGNVPMEARPALLDDAMTKWLRLHQDLKVRETLSITAHGNTVAVHVWFE